jgi:putative flippase GtrA
MISKLWKNQVVRFIVIGIANTLIDFGILNVLVFAFSFNKILANSISTIIAMIVSYILNYRVVFRHDTQGHVKKIIIFIVITAFGLLVLQNLVIYVFVHWITFPGNIGTTIIHAIGFSQLSRQFIGLNIAKALASAASMVWNYIMYKKFVFTDKPEPTDK